MSSSTFYPAPSLPFKPHEELGNTYTRTGAFLYLILLVSVVGRVPEIIHRALGTSFAYLFLILMLCLPLVLMSGGVRRLTQDKIFMSLFFLQVWYTVGLPFSNWKSGSLESYIFLIKTAPLYMFGPAFLIVRPQLRKAFVAVAIGAVFGFGQMATSAEISDDSRIRLGAGSFANSNELAAYLVMFMPFLILVTIRPNTNIIFKLGAAAVALASVGKVLASGSRGGVILLAILTVFLFLKLNVANKIKVGIPAVVVSVFLFTSLPSETKLRLLSLLDERVAGQTSALSSKVSRTQLLLESIDISIRNPIFGVGFGVYYAVAGDLQRDQNARRLWQTTHNAYTQVSAESGMPALACFLAALYFSFRQISRAKKIAEKFPSLLDLRLMADCLFIAVLIFAVNGFFANTAHDYPMYIILALVTPLYTITVREAAALEAAGQGPAQPTSGLIQNRFTSNLPASGGKFGPKPAAPIPDAEPEPVASNDPADQYGDVPWKTAPRKAGQTSAGKPPVALH